MDITEGITELGVREHVRMSKRDPHAFEKYLKEAQRFRRHAWVAAISHKISDKALAEVETTPPLFDGESLLSVVIACMICEVEYNPIHLGRACPGEQAETRWIACALCGTEYQSGSPAICRTHGLCARCHPEEL